MQTQTFDIVDATAILQRAMMGDPQAARELINVQAPLMLAEIARLRQEVADLLAQIDSEMT